MTQLSSKYENLTLSFFIYMEFQFFELPLILLQENIKQMCKVHFKIRKTPTTSL